MRLVRWLHVGRHVLPQCMCCVGVSQHYKPSMSVHATRLMQQPPATLRSSSRASVLPVMLCCFRARVQTPEHPWCPPCRSSSARTRRMCLATPAPSGGCTQPVSARSARCPPVPRPASRSTACLRASTSTAASPVPALRSSTWTCSGGAWSPWRRSCVMPRWTRAAYAPASARLIHLLSLLCSTAGSKVLAAVYCTCLLFMQCCS